MGIIDDIAGDWQASLAALAWQVDLGVDQVIGDDPVNRYALAVAEAPVPKTVAQVMPQPADTDAGSEGDAVAVAQAMAARAGTLEELQAALAGYDHCEIRRGARNLVFADGNPAARVLILGEAPGVEDDRIGRPFVGQAGQLLDAMFAAIGLSRSSPDPGAALYITHVMPWRPPNRPPTAEEIAMMRPFVERHIALVDPAMIVVMGNAPCTALGPAPISGSRGVWTQALGRPVLAMTHPDILLRQPAQKREAWADLLSVQARLRA